MVLDIFLGDCSANPMISNLANVAKIHVLKTMDS